MTSELSCLHLKVHLQTHQYQSKEQQKIQSQALQFRFSITKWRQSIKMPSQLDT